MVLAGGDENSLYLGCGTERRQSNQKTLAVLGKKHIYSQNRRQEMSAHRAEDMERDAA